MSDLAHDLESLSELLAEARLLRLVFRGTDSEPGLINEITEARAAAADISAAANKARELERINFDALADLRQALGSVSETITDAVTKAGSDFAVIDSIRTACKLMTKAAISESSADALREAAQKLQFEIDDEVKKIAVGKFGQQSAADIVEAWAELVESRKKIEILESEVEKLRASNNQFTESMNGSREMQFVSARDWAISGAIAGMIGGGIFGIGIAIFAVVTKIIVL